jgi:TM2 domain-containing membrane protein YozV
MLAIVITAILSWLVLRGSAALGRFLGVDGIDNLLRIMVFLLICRGAQLAVNGVKDLAERCRVLAEIVIINFMEIQLSIRVKLLTTI